MDSITSYGEENAEGNSMTFLKPHISTSSSYEITLAQVNNSFNTSNELTIHSNQPISRLPNEVSGPEHPYKNQFGMRKNQTQSTCIDDYTFDEQFKLFQKSGYAIDTTSNTILGNYQAFVDDTNKQIQENQQSKKKRLKLTLQEKLEKLRDNYESKNIGEEDDGPWMKDTESDEKEESIPIPPIESKIELKKAIELPKVEAPVPISTNIVKDKNCYIIESEEDAERWERYAERKISIPLRPARGSLPCTASSTFHGVSEVDYQGRSWIQPPSGLRPDIEGTKTCYIPKKCSKKFLGHTKGVTTIECFPKYGHLLLSASMDGKCKIWDLYNNKNVLRTYIGHTEAVKCATFDSSGKQFLSCGYDRYVRLWDVETGQVNATFTNRKLPYQVKFHPNNSNLFLAPSSDNKIYQVSVFVICYLTF